MSELEGGTDANSYRGDSGSQPRAAQQLEQILRGEQGIEVLTNVMSNGSDVTLERQPET